MLDVHILYLPPNNMIFDVIRIVNRGIIITYIVFVLSLLSSRFPVSVFQIFTMPSRRSHKKAAAFTCGSLLKLLDNCSVENLLALLNLDTFGQCFNADLGIKGRNLFTVNADTALIDKSASLALGSDKSAQA